MFLYSMTTIKNMLLFYVIPPLGFVLLLNRKVVLLDRTEPYDSVCYDNIRLRWVVLNGTVGVEDLKRLQV